MALRRQADDLELEKSYMSNQRLIEALKSLPDCEGLKKMKSYSVIDFRSDKAYLEIKSRRVRHDQYPTCLIGANKIEEFRRNKLKNYICWLYTDGLFYLPVDLDAWNYQTRIITTRRDCGIEHSEVYEIPYGHLTKLDY